MILLLKIILYPTIVLFGALALFAYRNAKKIFDYYRLFKPIKTDPEWEGFIRKDFTQWQQPKIKLGCIIRFPIKVILLLFYIGGLTILILFSIKFKTLGKKLVDIFVKYVGWLALSSIIDITEGVNVERSAPIIISNHVNWIDILYMTHRFYPISIVAKESIARTPIIGPIAKYIQCLFIRRESQQARQDSLQQIKQRVEDYNQKEDINQLLIFPQGTTSNGRSIMRFKIGAFAALPKLTVVGLIYDCEGFSMGMDELTPIEHFVISLSLQPKLIVKTAEMQPLQGQEPAKYMRRCQERLSELTGFKIYDCGYTEKCAYKEMRLNSLLND